MGREVEIEMIPFALVLWTNNIVCFLFLSSGTEAGFNKDHF